MAETNFLQWNPNKLNQQTDEQYEINEQRIDGAYAGITYPSPLANKLFYQCTTFITALAQALVSKGYDISDVSISDLITALSNILTKNEFGQTANTVCEGNDSRISGLIATPTEINTVAYGATAKNSHTHPMNQVEEILATAEEINTVAYGTTAKNNHGHTMNQIEGVLATAEEINTVAYGTTAKNNHSHFRGCLVKTYSDLTISPTSDLRFHWADYDTDNIFNPVYPSIFTLPFYPIKFQVSVLLNIKIDSALLSDILVIYYGTYPEVEDAIPIGVGSFNKNSSVRDLLYHFTTPIIYNDSPSGMTVKITSGINSINNTGCILAKDSYFGIQIWK